MEIFIAGILKMKKNQINKTNQKFKLQKKGKNYILWKLGKNSEGKQNNSLIMIDTRLQAVVSYYQSLK